MTLCGVGRVIIFKTIPYTSPPSGSGKNVKCDRMLLEGGGNSAIDQHPTQVEYQKSALALMSWPPSSFVPQDQNDQQLIPDNSNLQGKLKRVEFSGVSTLRVQISKKMTRTKLKRD